MQVLCILFIIFMPVLAEDFISGFEYGQMLYGNPRGVSCVSCHGETGEGRYIASYQDINGNIIDLIGSDIRHSTLNKLREAVLNGKGLMPRYFLTDDEIKTLYAYLKELNLPKR